MTQWPSVSFILVPQMDRRQQPDRRRFNRGSRRAVDLVTSAAVAPHDPAVIWTTTQNDGSRSPTEKPYLH